MGVISIVNGDYNPTYNWGGTTLYVMNMFPFYCAFQSYVYSLGRRVDPGLSAIEWGDHADTGNLGSPIFRETHV